MTNCCDAEATFAAIDRALAVDALLECGVDLTESAIAAEVARQDAADRALVARRVPPELAAEVTQPLTPVEEEDVDRWGPVDIAAVRVDDDLLTRLGAWRDDVHSVPVEPVAPTSPRLVLTLALIPLAAVAALVLAGDASPVARVVGLLVLCGSLGYAARCYETSRVS